MQLPHLGLPLLSLPTAACPCVHLPAPAWPCLPLQMYETAPAGPILKQAGVPEWPALAVFLLLEAGKGKQSAWSTYIATLPKTPPCILQW